MKMQESVLRRVRMVEEKHGITYAKTDGRLYKALRVSYTLLFIYTMGINLLFICGMLLTRLGTDNFKGILNSLITVIVCTVLIIAGYVLSFTRFKLVSGILSVLPEIMLVVVFGAIMKDSLGVMGFKVSYFWRHFAPLLILDQRISVGRLLAVTTVIAVRARFKTEKQYKKVLDNLYALYSLNSDDISGEQWEAFLEEYDPTDYKKIYKESKQISEENTEE